MPGAALIILKMYYFIYYFIYSSQPPCEVDAIIIHHFSNGETEAYIHAICWRQ